MKLTAEQQLIINAKGNIKINAVAGSGKTSTLVAYAKAQPKNSKILYLAFNKTVKLEAIKKFEEKGLKNVRVETAHSLAFGAIVKNSKYTVEPNNIEPYQMVKMLKLVGNAEKFSAYIVANHIIKFISYYCNSDVENISELNYLDTIDDAKAKGFAKSLYPYIENKTKSFLSKMKEGKMPITHDFYLKLFQLSNPQLAYDYILFDEGQDASAVMLAIFLNQKAVKVIVGDTHQQIYSWRYAINALDKTTFNGFTLNTSFRFNQTVADLATTFLDYKKLITNFKGIAITGAFEPPKSTSNPSKVVIARTNLGLLLKAIEYVIEKKKISKIYFEGNINSYTYADDGSSIYDILSLQNKNRKYIKNPIIAEMSNMDELKDYIDKTDDVQLGMMYEIVEKYGNEIPKIIKTLKDKQVDVKEKDKAHIIFSTVHKCKGIEYDEVQLVNDFISYEKIKFLTTEKVDNPKKVPQKKDLTAFEIKKINEEINLLYVAVTRAKHKLYIPDNILPVGYIKNETVIPTKAQPEVIVNEEDALFEAHILGVNYKLPNTTKVVLTVKEPEIEYKLNNKVNKDKSLLINNNKHWTVEMDNELTQLFADQKTPSQMQKVLKRSLSAISARLKYLDLFDH